MRSSPLLAGCLCAAKPEATRAKLLCNTARAAKRLEGELVGMPAREETRRQARIASSSLPHFPIPLDWCACIKIVHAMTRAHDQSSEPLAQASGLDVLSDTLRSVRLTGAMLFLVETATPWVSWAPQAEAFRHVVLPTAQHLISLHIV